MKTPATEIERRVRELIRLGKTSSQITFMLSKDKAAFGDVKSLDLIVDNICEVYPDYDLIQYFMESKIITDKNGDSDTLYMYNQKKRELSSIEPTALKNMISPKLSWHHRRHTCDFVYDPVTPYKLKKFKSGWKYNIYEPPEWLSDHFHSNGEVQVEKVTKIPDMYSKYLNHLCDGHHESIEYVLDWLANSIQGRNFCMLTTIGTQGIGKGILGDIMYLMVGSSNYSKTGKRIVENQFNSQIANKKIIYLDELKISSVDQENRLKDLINDRFEVEKKGHDAKLHKNYASIYISSNNLDAIKIPEDDRRFSVIELTNKKLLTVMSSNEIDKLANDKELAFEFAKYLYYRKVDQDKMLKVFRSKRVELLRSASLTEWQEWLIDSYIPQNAGKTIKVSEFRKIAGDALDTHNPPGRPSLLKFCNMYPSKFSVKNMKIDGSKAWCLVINGENYEQI